MCESKYCDVNEDRYRYLFAEKLSLKIFSLQELKKLTLPPRAEKALVSNFDDICRDILATKGIMGAIDHIIAEMIDEDGLNFNPRYMVTENDSIMEGTLLHFWSTRNRSYRHAFKKVRRVKKHDEVAKIFANVVTGYAYLALQCNTIEAKHREKGGVPHSLPKARLSYLKHVITDPETEPFARERLLGNTNWVLFDEDVKALLTQYAENVNMEDVRLDDMVAITKNDYTNHGEAAINRLIERGDENPQVINAFLAHIREHEHLYAETLLDFVLKYPSVAGFSALLTHVDVWNNQAFWFDKEEKRTKAIQLIHELSVDTLTDLRLPHREVIALHEPMTLEHMRALYRHPELSRTHHGMREYLRENEDERVLMMALQFSQYVATVVTKPTISRRILSYIDYINRIQKLDLEEALLQHPNQSPDYVLDAIRGGVQPYATMAVLSETLTPDEVLEVVDGHDSTKPQIAQELYAVVASRKDLDIFHVDHLLEKDKTGMVRRELEQNPYVIITDYSDLELDRLFDDKGES